MLQKTILGITWKQKVTNLEIIEKIKTLIGEYEPLLEVARRRKMQWFGHITRQPGSLAHTIMHGMVKGSRNRGRPKNTWLADIEAWTGKPKTACMREAMDREKWRRTVKSSKCPNGRQAMGVT